MATAQPLYGPDEYAALPDDTSLARFMAKVSVDPATGCWVWTASTNPHGYGKFGVGGRYGGHALAHRWAYEHLVGPIPPGVGCLHSCDNPPCVNPPCVNPTHLFLSTQADNVADMVAKGRSARGEKNGQSRLTAEQVLAIRDEYATGGVTMAAIGKKHGVGHKVVWTIVRRKRWGWL